MKTPSPSSFIFGREIRRSRRGVSPVIATTIILAITIVLGLALWGFANSGVGTATTQYSEAVTEYGEIVRNHRFVIANMDFNNPSINNVAFWVYNNGKLDATISSDHVILTCKDCTGSGPNPTGLTQDSPADLANPLTLPPKTLKKFYFNAGATLETGKTYELTVVSDAGLTNTFVKKMGD
jgi:flagellin-like protein